MPTTTPRTRDESDLKTAGGSTVDDPITDPLSSTAILSAAGQTELSFDGTFTPLLIEELSDPDRSLDEVMDDLSDDTLQARDVDGNVHDSSPSQAPTIARLGSSSPPKEDGTKKAVLIGNVNYTNAAGDDSSNIPTAYKDALGLAGALKSRNFAADAHTDKTAGEMTKLYTGAVQDGALSAGDSVVLYFSGHGTPLGPVGVGGTYEGFHEASDPASYQAGTIPNYEQAKSAKKIKRMIPEEAFEDALSEDRIEQSPEADIMPNSTLTSLVSMASARGLHLRIILDACFSGRSTDLVRDEYLSDIAETAKDGSKVSSGVSCAMDLDAWKEKVTTWRRGKTLKGIGDDGWWKSTAIPAITKLTDSFSALTGVAITPPSSGLDPVADIAEIHRQIDAALNAMIVALQAMIDGEDD